MPHTGLNKWLTGFDVAGLQALASAGHPPDNRPHFTAKIEKGSNPFVRSLGVRKAWSPP